MRLRDITATPHPAGNRIDLTWANPGLDQYPKVRVVRRKGTFPTSPTPPSDSEEEEWDTEPYATNAQGAGLFRLEDVVSVCAETVYYYALFPYRQDQEDADVPTEELDEAGREYDVDVHNRVAAMATAPYGMAKQMYELLPRIYHRYDAALAKTIVDQQSAGPLRRFLDLPGSQLDQLYSFARSSLDLTDLERGDGRLLPLLAQWIGWPTDHRLEIDAHRNEIRHAPHIYRRIGTRATVAAAVKRVGRLHDQGVRIKEFADNVFLTNAPEAIRRWEIFEYRVRIGSTDLHQPGPSERFERPLRAGEAPLLPEPRQLTRTDGFDGRPASVENDGGLAWLFWHSDRSDRWEIWLQPLNDATSTPRPAVLVEKVEDPGPDYTDGSPAALADGSRVWLFWESNRDGHWNIWTSCDGLEHPFATLRNGQPSCSPPKNLSNHRADDRNPAAVVDGDGNIRVFWQSNRRGPTDIWMCIGEKQHDNSYQWREPERVTKAKIRHETPAVAVDDETRIWLFYSCDLGDRKNIFVMTYDGAAWSDPQALTEGRYRDESPAAGHSSDSLNNVIWLFWHSNRDGNWQIWARIRDGNKNQWVGPGPITSEATSDKEPAVILSGPINFRLSWRSQRRGRDYQSRTIDFDDAEMLAHLGKFDDRAHYTYDTGTKNDDWYARDTVGIYLTEEPASESLVAEDKMLLRRYLRKFLPVHVRPVFVIEQAAD